MTLDIDRRRATRVQVCPYRVRMGRHDGHLIDASETGALVHSARPEEPDCRVTVHLEFGSEKVTLTARVVRCMAQPVTLVGAAWNRHEYRLGLEFVDYGSHGRRLLRELIARAQQRGCGFKES